MTPRVIQWNEAEKRLLQGEVGVLPTDTLYGLVAAVRKPAAVERVYALRERERDKPLIVLAHDQAELGALGIRMSERVGNILAKVWPGPVSVVVAATQPELEYLHRGSGGIAFRVPAKPELRQLLSMTGPLVAPSANLAGEPPAATIEEAYKYFGDQVFYVDGGMLNNPASALLDARTDPPKILRPAPGFALP